MKLTIDNIITDVFSNEFIPIDLIKQKKGFFQTANWLRFEVNNQSKQNDWLLEFSFALINDLQVYVKENERVKLLYKAGSDLPFNQREIRSEERRVGKETSIRRW